jgi:AbrB family looped-hinge helix DNA binding protein
MPFGTTVQFQLSPPCKELSVLGILMHRIATIRTRGRVTLPARIRQALQIAPGDNVVFVETAAGRFEVKAEARTAALLNRRPTTRRDVPVRRRVPQMQLPLPGSEPAVG